MSAFTPGPYSVRTNYEDASHNRSVAIVTDSGAVIALLKNAHGNKDANADLLSAAPDMYEVLKELATHYEGTDAPIGFAARAALAKAEGRQP